MVRVTAQAVVQEACQRLIEKASNKRQFQEVRDAAQNLHDNIEAYLRDTRPLPKQPQAPLQAAQSARSGSAEDEGTTAAPPQGSGAESGEERGASPPLTGAQVAARHAQDATGLAEEAATLQAAEMPSAESGADSAPDVGPSPRVDAAVDDAYTGNAGLLGWQADSSHDPEPPEPPQAEGDNVSEHHSGSDASGSASSSSSGGSAGDKAFAVMDASAGHEGSGEEGDAAVEAVSQASEASDADASAPVPVGEGCGRHAARCPELWFVRSPEQQLAMSTGEPVGEADEVSNGAGPHMPASNGANGAHAAPDGSKVGQPVDEGGSDGDGAADEAASPGSEFEAGSSHSEQSSDSEDASGGHGVAHDAAGAATVQQRADGVAAAAERLGQANLQDSMVEDYVPDERTEDSNVEGVVYSDATGSASDSAAPAVPPVATTVADRLVEDYVPSPPAAALVEAMTERAAFETVRVLRLACNTGRAPFIVVALGTIERLIARGFLRGEVASLLLDGEGRSAEEGSLNARGLSNHPEQLPVLAQALHLVCCCEDFGQEEEVEVAVLRAMLTIVSATAIAVHYVVLLLIIRACYNTYIMSRSDTTQQTAKAVLTQIVHIVFQRLLSGEAGYVQPVSLPDLSGFGARGDQRRDVLTAQSVVMSVWQSLTHPERDPAAVLNSDAFHPPVDADGRSEWSSRTAPESESTHHTDGAASVSPSRDAAPGRLPTPPAAPLPFPSPSASFAGSEAPVQATTSGGMAPRDHVRLLECAQKVIRALCKLAMLTSNVPGDTSVTNGRALAMELLAGLLLNHGARFKRYPKLMAVVKGELGNCLLANSKSSAAVLQRLTCHIFVLVLKTFREELKNKVAYLFRHTILKGLEPARGDGKDVDLDYRFVVFACLDPISADGQLLMDLFVNFDCDPDRTDTVLLERLFKLLTSVITNPDALHDASGSNGALPQAQRNRLRYAALTYLCQALHSLFDWHEQLSGIGALEVRTSTNIDGEALVRVRGPSAASDKAAELAGRKAKKKMRAEGIALFNAKPKKGLAQLQAQGLLSQDPADVAHFLRQTEGLDFAAVGEVLSDPADDCKAVMHSYVDAMDFTGLKFDDAIRMFLLDFRLPGEAQKIDRLMEKFAERYHVCNASQPDYPFANAGTAYVLSYSVIMLNTDQHNPTVKKRMTADDFVRNNRGIDDERDLPREFLEDLYARIRGRQIMMRHTMIESATDEGGDGETKYLLDVSFMTGIFALFGRTKELRPEPTEGQIAQLEEFLKAKTQGLTFYSSQHADELRPLVQTIWEFLLPTLSTTFSEAGSDQLLWQECLQGLVEAACLTCSLGLAFIASTFVRTLANFTSLHEPQSMRMQHAAALRHLLHIPDRVGSHLHENWVVILRCLSRWAFVSQVAAGAPTDLSLFATVDPDQKHDMKKSWWMGGRKQAGKPASPKAPMQPGTLLDAGMALSAEFLSNKLPPAGVMDAIDDDAHTRVFVSSVNLDPEAVVEFFHALTTVSLEELAGTPTARVFALSKIVDVCHHNINRPRIVWTSIWKGQQAAGADARAWQGLSEYFVDIGCHENLQVAMYAMDALRQIAEKFLERPELANMSFQNDFLKPFVVVMRQSGAKEIRELIIRQVSRMVLLQVGNVKSGWKSMFMVFSQAARDNEPTIVRLSFDTVEKIVREHFTVITETDVGVFADCVNCLTAFTNQSHDDNVALNAIAFLRFCAMRLAEGSIGDVDTLPDEVDMSTQRVEVTRFKAAAADGSPSPPASPSAAAAAHPSPDLSSRAASVPHRAGSVGPSARFSDHDEHLYFWMPLLIGLTELTFDPREALRISALDVLFDTLTEHGACFSEGFWAKVFERMLLPIFDSVQVDDVDFATFSARASDEASRDRWLYETCSHCLHHLINIIVKFYPLVHKQLPKVLVKIKAFMLRTHHSLACVGVTAMERLISRCGAQMSAAMWEEVVAGLLEVAHATLPDLEKLVSFPDERYLRGGGEATEGDSRAVYTLTDGLGARRLQQVQVRAHVQSLLVQSCLAIYEQEHAHMPDVAVCTLLATVKAVCDHAREVGVDRATRAVLAQWQAEDGIGADEGLPDPPLLDLEVEAASSEMRILRHLSAEEGDAAQARREACDVARRLFDACRANMERFEGPAAALDAAHGGHEGSERLSGSQTLQEAQGSTSGTVQRSERELLDAEQAALTPVLVDTLGALRTIPQESFKQHLKDLFPVLTRLIRCRSASVEMQVALSDLFAAKVGPLM